MSQDQTAKSLIENLQERARMLEKARAFFNERGVLEVDPLLLNTAANIDDHIDPIEVTYLGQQKGFLHTCPEIQMKKLLARGAPDIYSLGHVFRDHERGSTHHVEFTMVEWYRLELSFEELIEETLDFIRLFVGEKPATVRNYHEIFFEVTGLNLKETSRKDLLEFICSKLDDSIDFSNDSNTDLEIFIFSECVEPLLKDQGLTVIQNYPKDQAALARTQIVDGIEVARRFEIYDEGLELANGYDEMRGGKELLERYKASNLKRIQHQKNPLPIDEEFIQANEHLPDCRGVSVGFDRVFMLYRKCKEIRQVQLG